MLAKTPQGARLNIEQHTEELDLTFGMTPWSLTQYLICTVLQYFHHSTQFCVLRFKHFAFYSNLSDVCFRFFKHVRV